MTEISGTTDIVGDSKKQTGVITRYARAWERGDIGEIVECYDEQIVAHYGGQSAFAGTYTGRDQFLTLLLETGSRGRRKLIAIDQLHDDGDSGAFFVTESFVIGGETVTVQRALRFRTNGKAVTECWLFDQDQHLVDKAWAQEAAQPN
jgi:ketosteroid isomerase-like protein